MFHFLSSEELFDRMREQRKTELDRLRSLALDMGRVIRSMDESGEHSEFWTQDGDYIIDGRFPK